MITEVLSGVLLPFCLFLAGGYFTFKIGTCFLRYPKKTVLGMLHSQGQGGTSPVRALTVALAGRFQFVDRNVGERKEVARFHRN